MIGCYGLCLGQVTSMLRPELQGGVFKYSPETEHSQGVSTKGHDLAVRN